MTRRIDHIHVHIGHDEQIRAEVAGYLQAAERSFEFVDEHTIEKVLPNIEVLLSGIAPRIDWAPAKRLRLLHFMGAGIDHLWPATGLDPKVVIANARGIHGLEMRDHTLVMLLAFERELPMALEQQRQRRWVPFLGGSLSGKTLGLIGLGEVGLPIARAARALGMRVFGLRNRPLPTPEVDSLFSLNDLFQFLSSLDYLVVTAPLTSKTRGMIGSKEIAQLPPHAVVIVISRGGIIDETALDAALREERIRGAALDVFATEPLPASSNLWSTPNLLITPHISGWVPGYVSRGVSLFLTNLRRLEDSERLLTEVDREREY
jgi:phosphoglycerate dehydrogenase-like enzyme